MPPAKDSKDKKKVEETPHRIAIVDGEKCKPSRCRLECKKSCPVNANGKQCIVVESSSKISNISETLCIGCGVCVKKCPMEAISIINLPSELASQTIHRYGPNSFKLHRLPIPRRQQVLGLVGINGIGKSTVLKILAGKLTANGGNFGSAPSWNYILDYSKGTELQAYFTSLIQNEISASLKPQYIDDLPKKDKKKLSVQDLITSNIPPEAIKVTIADYELENVLDRKLEQLSGGELQRFACALVAGRPQKISIFDEPSSFLDIRQRMKIASCIRKLIKNDRYIIVVEHDLCVLDYLSDFVCILYGVPGAYGVVSHPFSVSEGINIFLSGFLPTENLKFRESSLDFKITENADKEDVQKNRHYSFPDFSVTFESFKLNVTKGEYTNSEIIVLLGENGTGKTSFIKVLAGKLESDSKKFFNKLSVSYKRQTITPKNDGLMVKFFLQNHIGQKIYDKTFNYEVVRPLAVDKILDREMNNLSGGELQRVAICLCLGTDADIYLIDEPSAYLDAEQRVNAAKVIKRFILQSKKTAFVVEHDFIMSTYLADRVIVFQGKASVHAETTRPMSLVDGMNMFLKSLGITFRRDPSNWRPRVNKKDSVKDTEQKAAENFFCDS